MFHAALVWLHMMVPRMTFKAQTGIQHWSSMSGFRWPYQERMTKQDGRLGSERWQRNRNQAEWKLFPRGTQPLRTREYPKPEGGCVCVCVCQRQAACRGWLDFLWVNSWWVPMPEFLPLGLQSWNSLAPLAHLYLKWEENLRVWVGIEIDRAVWGACLALAMITDRSQKVYRLWAWGWAVWQ